MATKVIIYVQPPDAERAGHSDHDITLRDECGTERLFATFRGSHAPELAVIAADALVDSGHAESQSLAFRCA